MTRLPLPLDLVERVAARARDPRTFIDCSEFAPFGLPEPMSGSQLETAEARLGFRVPAALAELYRRVANGGFGPGCGMLGLDGGGTDDQGYTADALVGILSQSDPEDLSWEWQPGVLPISYWGCSVYSCLTPSGAVIGLDGDWIDTESVPLAEWLEAWVDGSLRQPGST